MGWLSLICISILRKCFDPIRKIFIFIGFFSWAFQILKFCRNDRENNKFIESTEHRCCYENRFSDKDEPITAQRLILNCPQRILSMNMSSSTMIWKNIYLTLSLNDYRLTFHLGIYIFNNEENNDLLTKPFDGYLFISSLVDSYKTSLANELINIESTIC